MDAKAEFELFEKIRDVARGRTVILISHRMSTVRLADHIYVLADGELTEGGTHDELIQRKGTYATLYQLQAQHFHANGKTVT
jgi:ATP-binding cassette subfamily B protein